MRPSAEAELAAMAAGVRNLPTQEWPAQPADAYSSFSECAICLSDFLPGETVKLLPCKHAFHASCIDEWLLSKCTARGVHPTCPLCKAVACRPGAAALRPPATPEASSSVASSSSSASPPATPSHRAPSSVASSSSASPRAA